MACRLARTDSFDPTSGVAFKAPTYDEGPDWKSAGAYKTQGPPYAFHDRQVPTYLQQRARHCSNAQACA